MIILDYDCSKVTEQGTQLSCGVHHTCSMCTETFEAPPAELL
jgi:hypothetical protein